MYDYNRLKNHVRGVESSSYELFGSHIELGGVYFSVYAPAASLVSLCGDFCGWNDIPMDRDNFGVWSIFIEGIGEGTMYKYRVTSADGQVTEKTDPFAVYNEKRGTCSIVYNLDIYRWRDDDWISSRDKNYSKPLNIYEVHLGTWKVKDDKTGDERFYEYEELKRELVPYVSEMGYTHIEFMPLCEYPFDGSWGYQGTGFYAPTSRYGEPRYLMDLIDTCHLNGIGVILDFVPVHFATDENGLSQFDGSYLYESEIPQLRESAWGSLRFDYSKPHVQSFVRSAINFWINTYHFDGIRFDAVAYLIFPDGTPNEPEYDCGVWFLKNTLYTLGAYHPDVMFIAEDASVHIKDTAPVIYGGFGFDYMWNFGWSAETLNYIASPYNMRAQNHEMMTYPMYYFNQGLFMLALSHDDVSNGKSTIMNNVYGESQEEKFANLRAYYTYQMTHPGKKMNFMGNELAEYMEWGNEQPLGWNLLSYPNHDSFHEYIRALNMLYLIEPALYEQDYDIRAFSWIDLGNSQNNIYAYRRDGIETAPIFVVLNFSPYEKEYWLSVGFDSAFREVLNSDRDIYGGSNLRNYDLYTKDRYLGLRLAPLSAVVLKPCGDDEVEHAPQPEPEQSQTDEQPEQTDSETTENADNA